MDGMNIVLALRVQVIGVEVDDHAVLRIGFKPVPGHSKPVAVAVEIVRL